jgi:hypothetical protein
MQKGASKLIYKFSKFLNDSHAEGETIRIYEALCRKFFQTYEVQHKNYFADGLLNPIKTNTVVPNPIDYIKRLPTPNTKKNFYSAFMKFIELRFSIKFEADKDIATEEKNGHKAVMAQVIGFMKMGQPKIWRKVEGRSCSGVSIIENERPVEPEVPDRQVHGCHH